MSKNQIDHNILTLDYWQDNVAYEGTTVPSGTIGCEVLNVSEETIRKLTELCQPINQIIQLLNSGMKDASLLPGAKASALQIIDLLKDAPPFSYLDVPFYRSAINKVFTEEYWDDYRGYQMALLTGSTMSAAMQNHPHGLLFGRVIPVLAQMGFSMGAFRTTMLDFATKMDAPGSNRTPEGLAELFGECFPNEITFGDDDSWMALTNVSVHYISAQHPEKQKPMLVKRMNFVSFVGMFRADLFEGLCVGHAPKKCPICGRWFLTTNARPTKYCGNKAPGDPRGRTCRQLGNVKGRDMRELAADHPVKQIFERRRDTINKAVKRGSLGQELAEAMKLLAKNKETRALSDIAYAKGAYTDEMEQAALMAEAKAQM